MPHQASDSDLGDSEKNLRGFLGLGKLTYGEKRMRTVLNPENYGQSEGAIQTTTTSNEPSEHTKLSTRKRESNKR
jgi:hypothetical protein